MDPGMKKVESRRHLQEYDYYKSWDVGGVRKTRNEGGNQQSTDRKWWDTCEEGYSLASEMKGWNSVLIV